MDIWNLRAEQIIRAWDIEIDGVLCRCPFHDDRVPSAQINERNIYCHACNETWNNYELVKVLLEKKYGDPVSPRQVFEWFESTPIPERSERHYGPAQYNGPANPEVVDYWLSFMDDDKYAQLEAERLITKETALRYKLGWRQDWDAWSIPYWRGEPGESEIDIVQFRLTDSEAKTKYIGLKGHNRPSIMNAHVLQHPQPYVVLFPGTYDPILAVQDGVIAVGMNGCTAFNKREKQRFIEYFDQQSFIFIVPDHTEPEIKPAYQLQRWLGDRAQVKFWPDIEPGLDYIRWRQLGHTAQEFVENVLNLRLASLNPFVQNVQSLFEAGDPYDFMPLHLLHCQGVPAYEVGQMLAAGKLSLPRDERGLCQRELCGIIDADQLLSTLQFWAPKIYANQGTWG